MNLAPQEVREAWDECSGRALASGGEWYRHAIFDLEPILPLDEPMNEYVDIKTYDFRIDRHENLRDRSRMIEVSCNGDFVWRRTEPLY